MTPSPPPPPPRAPLPPPALRPLDILVRDLISPLAPPSRLLPFRVFATDRLLISFAAAHPLGPPGAPTVHPYSYVYGYPPPYGTLLLGLVTSVTARPFSGSMLLRSLIALGYPGSPSYPYPFPPPGATLAAGAPHAPGAAAALGHLPAPGAPPAASVPAYLPAPPPIAPGGALTMRQLLRGSYTHHSCTLIHSHERITNARSAGRRLSVPLPLLPLPLSALWLPAPAWRCVL